MEESAFENLANVFGDPSNFSGNFSDVPWLLPLIGLILMIFLILYVYNALTLMAIAKKLGDENAWMAWVPFANIYLSWKISQTPQWMVIVYFIGLFAGGLPLIGFLISLGISVIAAFWLWRICERLGKPGWWAIFSILLYPVWLVFLGMLAWGETTVTQIPPVGKTNSAPIPTPADQEKPTV